jgi:hypothetical protein
MDSRPILANTDKITVHIDSSIDSLLRKGNRLANAILMFSESQHLQVFRSPMKTENDELRKVPECKIIYKNEEIEGIELDHPNYGFESDFTYKRKEIQTLCQKYFQKNEIDSTEYYTILQIFIQAVICQFDKHCVYVTNDRKILQNRLWFESQFRYIHLNIMSVEESALLLDLFFKKKGFYYISSRLRLNKGGWYWCSMRHKLPHYNVKEPIIDSLSYRFYFSLIALDEIGIQFYQGANNDTMDNTLYHFNYLISLVTGIFDNLALKTNECLSIRFSVPHTISLSNVTGREFLRKIREKNPDIRKHIETYMPFIRLIYLFRPKIIHREGLVRTSYERTDEIKWKANFIRISNKISDFIKFCGDSQNGIDPFTTWGVYKENGDIFLEPYNFSLKAISMLQIFVDKYLQLLGFPSYIDIKISEEKRDRFTNTLLVFQKYHLGF